MDPVRGSSEADAIDLCDSSDGDGDGDGYDGGGDGAAAPCSSAGTDPGAPSEGNRILGRLHAERMKRAGRGGDGDGTGGGAGKRRRPMPISMPMPMPKSMPPPPFRLFAAFPPGGEAGARPHRSTLRQILGVDKDPGGGSAGGLGPMQWIVIANFLIDFDWLLDEVPELLSLRRAVVYYGHACGGSPPNRWGRAGGRGRGRGRAGRRPRPDGPLGPPGIGRQPPPLPDAVRGASCQDVPGGLPLFPAPGGAHSQPAPVPGRAADERRVRARLPPQGPLRRSVGSAVLPGAGPPHLPARQLGRCLRPVQPVRGAAGGVPGIVPEGGYLRLATGAGRGRGARGRRRRRSHRGRGRDRDGTGTGPGTDPTFP